MSQAPTSGTPEDFDVVILGAGINGAGPVSYTHLTLPTKA